MKESRGRKKRKYDSTRRKAQSLETQMQIVEAAGKLFIERGYIGTSIEKIAGEAGVAAETIYSIFGNKKSILTRVVDVAVVGDGELIPLLARAKIREVENEKDQNRQIQMFVEQIQLVMSRVAPMFNVMRGVVKAEPEIDVVLKKYLDGRLQGMGYFIDQLTANGPLRKGLDKQIAATTIWGLTSAEVYNLYINDRGWSAEEYQHWLADTLIRLLLP